MTTTMATTSDDANNNKKKKPKKVLVIGGGPAGGLTAKAIADQGSDGRYTVQLYESYPYPQKNHDNQSWIPDPDPKKQEFEEEDADGGGDSGASSVRIGRNKTYVIGLGERGQHALRTHGIVPDELDGSVRSRASIVHPSGPKASAAYSAATAATAAAGGSGDKKKRKKNPPGVRVITRGRFSNLYLIPRAALASGILDEAVKSGVDVHCSRKLIDIDFDKKIATFSRQQPGVGGGKEEEEKVEYDLLVGADGTKSTVRSLLLSALQNKDDGDDGPAFQVKTEEDVMEYQVVILPPWQQTTPPPPSSSSKNDKKKKSRQEKALDDILPYTDIAQAWMNKSENATVFSWPLSDGRQLLTIIYPRGKLDTMRINDTYDKSLYELFPDMTLEARTSVKRQLRYHSSRPSSGGTCVWTSTLSPNPIWGVVLVGDSGHGMFPSLGQGCNAALESAAVLSRVIQSYDNDDDDDDCDDDTAAAAAAVWAERVAYQYNIVRHPDAKAVVDLTFSGYGSRNSRASNHMPFLYKVQLGLVMLLNKLSCGIIIPPPAITRLGNYDVNYRTLYRYNVIYEKIVLYGFLYGVIPYVGYYWGLNKFLLPSGDMK